MISEVAEFDAAMGEIDRLLASIDLLLVPVMGTAAWSIAAMAAR